MTAVAGVHRMSRGVHAALVDLNDHPADADGDELG